MRRERERGRQREARRERGAEREADRERHRERGRRRKREAWRERESSSSSHGVSRESDPREKERFERELSVDGRERYWFRWLIRMEKRTAPNWFSGKGSLSIFDCDIPYSDILAEMNYTHVDLEIMFSEYRDSDSEYRLKEWGIRLLKDRGGNDTTRHYFPNGFKKYNTADLELLMMHNRIYCLWLNKEEESDSQLEITNRLCLVSGCEGCCLVVEYDDHWLSPHPKAPF
ncbi:BnaC02g47210D [Brassica napus]|uniref:BnaC02g47210D protein n=1 Tax=Brassica napus TaxID=3708 RepID=A0A078IVX5_BRANA|nr:BnaC02g47210D [Brassica napus]